MSTTATTAGDLVEATVDQDELPGRYTECVEVQEKGKDPFDFIVRLSYHKQAESDCEGSLANGLEEVNVEWWLTVDQGLNLNMWACVT